MKPWQIILKAVIIFCIAILCLWFLGVLGQAYESHLEGFILLWLFIPILALSIRLKASLRGSSKQELTKLRPFLTLFVACLSFLNFGEYNRIRDHFGHRYIAGYDVHYIQDAETDYWGHPTQSADVTTASWRSTALLRASEWVFFISWFALPYLTWWLMAAAIKNAGSEQGYH
ncbi:MAG: hypothetical protein ACRD50_05485 [Candidatus Acidiferrales bacterium]